MSSQIKESFNNVLDYANNSFNFLMQSEQNYIIITFVIIFFILFSLISWIYSKLIIKSKACNSLDILYSDTNPFKSTTFMHNDGTAKKYENENVLNIYDLDAQDEFNKYALPRNFYVKTAYNCCCIEGYKNNFVAICGLDACIKQGARCLDFEIYSLNNEPIIAASTANNNFIKETYNYVKFVDALKTIKLKAFDESHTNCHLDPLYLHFRIMSENATIFDKMGDYIERILYDSNSSNSPYFINNVISDTNYDGKFYLETNIKYFNQKIIIICYCKNKNLIRQRKIKNYINLISNSEFFSVLRYETIEASGINENSLLVGESKRKFFMVLPNLNNKLDNYDHLIPLNQGCHFIAMKFQNFDSNLAGYFNFFKNQGGFSFILKPKKLLLPLNPNPDYSDGGVDNNAMPYTIRNNPPTYVTISGNLINKLATDNYKALMCGNPNDRTIFKNGYQPQAVYYYKDGTNGSFISEISLNYPNFIEDNIKTCGEIFDLSPQFRAGAHINDDQRIMK